MWGGGGGRIFLCSDQQVLHVHEELTALLSVSTTFLLRQQGLTTSIQFFKDVARTWLSVNWVLTTKPMSQRQSLNILQSLRVSKNYEKEY